MSYALAAVRISHLIRQPIERQALRTHIKVGVHIFGTAPSPSVYLPSLWAPRRRQTYSSALAVSSSSRS